jgi:hypothetical protein
MLLIGGFAFRRLVRCAAVAAGSAFRAGVLAPRASALHNWIGASAMLGRVVEQLVILVRVRDALLVLWATVRR